MATDDIQRLVTGSAPTPATFKIPGNGQIRPKTIYASFDGTGAVGAFKPALKITSDAGELVGIYATDDAVAAGASADVSWFPRVGAGGGSVAGVSSAWFVAFRNSNQSIPAGNTRKIGWTSHQTSDTSVFSVTSGVVANDTVHGLKAGIYVAQMNMEWATPQNYPRSGAIITDFRGAGGLSHSPATDSATDLTAAGVEYDLGDAKVLIPTAALGEVSVLATNFDVAAHNVTACTFSILYLSNDTFAT